MVVPRRVKKSMQYKGVKMWLQLLQHSRN